MTPQAIPLTVLLALCSTAARAGVLESADALWKFDYAASGSPVTAPQITDANDTVSGDQSASSVTNGDRLNWTTVPANGPAGGVTIDPFWGGGRGLEFAPQTVPGNPDTVTNGGFTVNGFSVSGSSSIVTRFHWDGHAYDDPGVEMSWLVNNGLGGGTVGWMFGVRGDRLTVHQSGGKSFDSSLALTPGNWYDAAAVFHDEDGTANDTITLYLYPQGGTTLLSDTVTQQVASTANPTFRVGSETLGGGTGNERKAFDGIVDYIAVWDRELSGDEVFLIMNLPEPSTLALAALGLLSLAFCGRRRKRRE
jgi:hypothetical protein